MTKKQNKKVVFQNTLANNERRKTFLILFTIIAVTALAYSTVINNDFVNWDDTIIVTNNPDIRAISTENVYQYFSKSYAFMYEPLVMMSYAIEYYFFGLNPAIYHTTNLAIHIINVILIYFFVFRISKNKSTALIVACIFGIHPMHVESVAWVTERKDLLFAFFFFGSLLLYLKDSETKRVKFYILSLVAFLFSLLSKSTAVVLPLVLFVVDYYKLGIIDKSTLKRKIPFIVLSVFFGIISLYTQQEPLTISPINAFGIIDRILIIFYSISFYIIRYLIPYTLSAFHPFPSLSGQYLPVQYYLAPLFLLFMIYLGARKSTLQRDIRFGLLFFITTILLTVNILPVGLAITAERYTYISYIGLSFIIGQTYTYAVSQKWKGNKTVHAWLLGIICIGIVLMGYSTNKRVKDWNNSMVLSKDTIDKSGPSETFNRILSVTYFDRGKIKLEGRNYYGALYDFDSSIYHYEKFYGAYYKRGVVRKYLHQPEAALKDFDRAILLEPNNAFIYGDRGSTKYDLQDYNGAIKDYQKALQLDSSLGAIHFNLGMSYLSLKNMDAACEEWERSLKMGIRQAETYIKDYCR